MGSGGGWRVEAVGGGEGRGVSGSGGELRVAGSDGQ